MQKARVGKKLNIFLGSQEKAQYFEIVSFKYELSVNMLIFS